MTPEAADLFRKVVDLPAPDRDRQISEYPDEAVRLEVLELLRYDDDTGAYLQQVVAESADSLKQQIAQQQAALPRFGAYQSVSVLGRGGMGAVYLAEREDGAVKHRVAVKVLPMASRAMLDRFDEERQILARLDHPNIARFHDAGLVDGSPYLMMELIEGEPLDVYCEAHSLGMGAILDLFLAICDAVAYAHRNLVLHRDLKPRNILVTPQGQPKLVDFGIGKIMREADAAGDTRTAFLALTPDYASPEQVRGQAVGVSTDIYSLGAILYHMLTGKKPHQLTGSSPSDLERAICEVEVRPPSQYRKELKGDLENVVMKALHKDPDRRYLAVGDLAADLRRYIERRPVLATPDSLGYRARRFVDRNWRALALAAVVAAALLSLGGFALLEARRAASRSDDLRKISTVLLFDVEQAIRNVPGATEARRVVVSTGLKYLDRLREDAQSDPALAAEVAEAYVKLADTQNSGSNASLGQRKEAIASLRRAVELYQIANRSTASDATRQNYFKTLAALAQNLNSDLQTQQALAILSKGIEDSESWVKQSPGKAEALESAAQMNFQGSRAFANAGQLDRAILAAERNLDLCKQLAANRNDSGGGAGATQRSMTTAYFELANRLHQAGRQKEAVAAARQAVQAQLPIASVPGAAYPVRRTLLIAYAYLGDALQALGDDGDLQALAECIQVQLKAVKVAETAAAEDAANVAAQEDRVLALQRLAMAQHGARDSAAAIQTLERAVALSRDLAKRGSGERRQYVFTNILFRLAAVLVEADQPAKALPLLEEARAVGAQLLAKSPADTRAMTTMLAVDRYQGEAFQRLGNHRRALELLTRSAKQAEEVLRMDPRQSVAKSHLTDLQTAIAKSQSALR